MESFCKVCNFAYKLNIMTTRNIEVIVPPREPHFVGDGFRVHNFIPGSHGLTMQRMDPFIMLDYNSKYYFTPSKEPRGVGVHPQTGKVWLESSNEGVGFGAHAGGDGENGLMHMTEPGCRNNPIEVREAKAPLLVEDYRLIQDSGGAGRHRGGLGLRRSYRFLSDASALTLVKKTKTAPWGTAGGDDGESYDWRHGAPAHLNRRRRAERRARASSLPR